VKAPAEDQTATSREVLDYYARNWERIVRCYELDDSGLPYDPAWYRRQLYKDVLRRRKPTSVLDIGCGGGWTVLDALELGVDARGIEPVPELARFASDLLAKKGYDSERVQIGDLAGCAALPDASQDCVALLSVLPHVPRAQWEPVHADLARVLRPGGMLVAAYRNELFDLYTFNSFTVEFYDTRLWNNEPCRPLHDAHAVDVLKKLVTNPDVPGPYFTASQDVSFGRLERTKSNPLTIGRTLRQFGFAVEAVRFYHFHCVPPLIAGDVPDFRRINHEMEASMSSDWRANFMAAMFVVEAIRS
jgi:SAM-dependent methyltransferase